jgi:hypothetical protein
MPAQVRTALKAACRLIGWTVEPRVEILMKNAYEQSLRYQVEKWLAPGNVPVRVTQFSRTFYDRRRFVRVEVLQGAASKALYFFRHDDGHWCPYPPGHQQRNTRSEQLTA